MIPAVTPRERIEAVFTGQAQDRVPVHHIGISSRVATKLLGREACVGGGVNQWRESVARWEGPDALAAFAERTAHDAIDIAIAMDQDLVRPGYWRESRTPVARLDEYTFRYEGPPEAYVPGGGAPIDPRGDPAWEVKRLNPETELFYTIDAAPRPLLTVGDLATFVSRLEQSAADYAPTAATFADIGHALDAVADERAVRATGAGLAVPMDDAVWMEALLERPDLVERCLDAQVERALKNIPVLVDMGAHLIFGGGDFAIDGGPMYSPDLFHRIMLPRLRRISKACHDAGAFHLFGSDGDVRPVAADLYGGSEIDGHYEFDRRAGMSASAVHAEHPNLAMLGGISSWTLHRGSIDDVRAEVRLCLAEARETGKLIVGCSNVIMPQVPDENLAALVETLAER
ncbi:MAG: hypothetical protein CMJ18_20955 [Phycisphaeraceae bacterium]|nr:hypothetical protein [Phycisphaeraceae bacterium]